MEEIKVVANFPITHDVTLSKRGTHRDLGYKVVNHNRQKYDFGRSGNFEAMPSLGTWCYYVTVSELMLPAELFAEFWLQPSSYHERSGGRKTAIYNYHNAKFADVEWHGGVSFYEKQGGFDEIPRSVTIGCDYGHLWDEGREYSLDRVVAEAQETIDQLHAIYPFYTRCPYNGAWQPASEMVEHEGKRYSASGLASMLKYESERRV